MRQILGKMLALAAFAGFASGAQAIGPTATYDFGILDRSKGVSVEDFSGSFDNTFSFTQGAYPGVRGTLVGFDLVGDMFAQSRVGDGATPVWHAWIPSILVPSDPDTGAFAFSQIYNALTAGQTYWFELRGTATQGAYQIALAPIPEPEAWALFLSGLGLMAYVVRRRRHASAA